MKRYHLSLLCLVLFILLGTDWVWAVPAFPGAEGYGAVATGGRGGAVYEVTNLNSSGAGSFGEAIAASGARTVVFRVSGTITGNFSIRNDNITIAGQTAPGDGICIKGSLSVSANNVIIRYIRVRQNTATTPEGDAIGGRYHHDIIFDHISASWSGDEVMSLYHNTNVTIQWCMISEACAKFIDGQNTGHQFGGIWGNNYGTYHHNLIADNVSRNPRWASGCKYNDYRNNVIYNWNYQSCYGGGAVQSGMEDEWNFSTINMIANYYKAGPATDSAVRDRIAEPSDDAGFGSWYVADNYVDGYPAVTADNWLGIDGSSYIKLSAPWDAMAINQQSPADAYDAVLASAGCSKPNRDSVDATIIQDVTKGTATWGNNGILTYPTDAGGGWPTLASGTPPTDSDHDGMPDDWETDHGLNPGNAADRNDYTLSTDYTNLEVYLDYLANATAPTPNPMTWKAKPQAAGSHSIFMQATTATDDSGVEYFFDCVNDDAFDSGWQDSSVYYREDYAEGATYQFRVKARDKSELQGETGFSVAAEATTASGYDNLPPAPNPSVWASAPHEISLYRQRYIRMSVLPSYDENGVEYYFDCIYAADENGVEIDSSAYDSGWVTDPSYTVKVVQSPNYEYVFQAYARQKNADPNDTTGDTYVTDPTSTRGTSSGSNPRTLEVPYPYATIQSAINSANDGDTVVVHPGHYGAAGDGENIDFAGKAITVRSVNPSDPATVASTIIDPLVNARGGFDRAFIFQSGEGRDSVLDGFTIQNAEAYDPTAPDVDASDLNGVDALGGAIACFNGASPTISNCVIRDSYAWGQNGQNGADGDSVNDADAGTDGDSGIDGENGGHGGNGYGGAIYCDDHCSPLITNCKIENCYARGGDGGYGGNGSNGGNGGSADEDGVNGGNGGRGGNGGHGGNGGNGCGGAIYFGHDSHPEIVDCEIDGCYVLIGMGNRGGQAGNGGNGGDGGPAGDAGVPGNGGNGGDGGFGGNAGHDGGGRENTWTDGHNVFDGVIYGGAIYADTDCVIEMSGTVVSDCYTSFGRDGRGGADPNGVGGTTTDRYDGGNGGNGGNGGVGGDGGDAGDGLNGNGGNGGNGGDNGGINPDSGSVIVNGVGGNGGNGGAGGNGGDAAGGNGGDAGVGPATGGSGGDGNPAGTDGASTTDPQTFWVTGWGGAILLRDNTVLEATDCEFDSNHGDDDGGTIYAEFNTDTVFTGCSFSASVAEDDGGAVCYEDPNSGSFTSCTFTNNLAGGGEGGGAIGYNEGGVAGSLYVTDSVFTGNKARSGQGGAIWIPASGDLMDYIHILNSQFTGNVSAHGGAIYVDQGSMVDMQVQNCQFTSNTAYEFGNYSYHGGYGGAISVYGVTLTVGNCDFTGNATEFGGAIYSTESDVQITGSDFMQNTANNTNIDGSGGALYCLNESVRAYDCTFTENGAMRSGGAVYLIGPFDSIPDGTQDFVNCLMANNTAGVDGGAFAAMNGAEPYLINSTLYSNTVTDSLGYGGGVSCGYNDISVNQSFTLETLVFIENSILWGNDAAFGKQVSLGDPASIYGPDVFCDLILNYADIQGGFDDVFLGEPAENMLAFDWGENTVIDIDPYLTKTGSDLASSCYLGSIAAGQLADSECHDKGTHYGYLSWLYNNGAEFGPSDFASLLGLPGVTTRTDHVADTGTLDLGYHYDASLPVKNYTLTAGVKIADMLRHGELEVQTPSLTTPVQLVDDPNTATYRYTFKQGTVVKLQATPDQHYRISRWIGTDNDSFYYGQTNTVTMTQDSNVQVEFESALPKKLYVPSVYDTIEDAVVAARSGDLIVLAPRPDEPYRITNPNGINFGGKQLVITSQDPDDPDIVAQTIIDCQGSRTRSKRAFHFDSGEDPNSIIEGITIRNAFTAVIGLSGAVPTGLWPWWNGPDPDPWDVTKPDPDPLPPARALSGEDATGDSYGGAILIENGSSPTIRNCVFENCTVAGGVGGNGNDGFPMAGQEDVQDDLDSQSGGNGGNGSGNGYGGAIAVLSGSSPSGTSTNPTIVNCTFIKNRATGGWGGVPGDAGTPYNNGRYGWGGNAGNASGDGHGGAIFVEAGCHPTINDCTFEGNFAKAGQASSGGAASSGGNDYPDPYAADPWEDPMLRRGSDGVVTTSGTIAGGAVFFDENANNMLTNCTFVNNSAYDVITYTTFVGSTTTREEVPSYTRGGAIYVDTGATLDVADCNFVDNLAGALYSSTGSSLALDHCEFNNNRTVDVDAALAALSTGTVSSVNGQVSRDIAGAVTIDSGPAVPARIDNCTFMGNQTDASGGAILADGDVVVTNSAFNANIATGNGGAFYSYHETSGQNLIRVNLKFDNCDFSGNESKSGLGGAGYARTAVLDMDNCFFVKNKAASGGGLYAAESDIRMQGMLLYGNEATGTNAGSHQTIVGEGNGGGLFIVDSLFTISDARFVSNLSRGVVGAGAGLCVSGAQSFQQQKLRNCLFAENHSENAGGGIACQQFVDLTLDSCTIANNISDSQLGGGIFVDHDSGISLHNSILSGNKGYGIYEKRSANGSSTAVSDADYALFYDNTLGDLFDAQTNQGMSAAAAPGYTHILSGNPNFTTGPLGGYYLTQTSPAVDAGSMSAADAMLDTYTTDPAGMLDQGVLDLGYHYDDPSGIPSYHLNAQVQSGAGTVMPASGTYLRGAVVHLVANVDTKYFLTGWSGGTINDNSKEPDNVVLMTRDKLIEVLTHLKRTLNVGSSAEYDTLGDALDDAQDGDIIFVAPGHYTAASQFPSGLNIITLQDKEVTISGANPDDESVVRATVFNNFSLYLSGLSKKSIIEGITFEGSRAQLHHANLIIRNCVFSGCRFSDYPLRHMGDVPAGADGYSQGAIMGGAIEMFDSSPKVINCIFENNSVTGVDGEDGYEGDDNHPNGGDGGWPSRVYGGAVYCGLSSNPEFTKCTFTGNEVFGANGGNGADYVTIDDADYLGGRGGGWVYDDAGEQRLIGLGWDGWTYESFGDKYFGAPYASYYREYDLDQWAKWFNWNIEGYDSWDDFIANPPADPYDQLMDPWRYSGYGGAVYCELDSDVTFKDCVFEGNQSHGGLTGVGGAQSVLRLGNTVPWPDRQLNMPTAGGAVFAALDSDLTFENCEFRNNVADVSTVDLPHTYQISFGGAVAYEFGCNVTFKDCQVDQNQATVGGGIYGYDSTVTVDSSSLSGNEAYLGAGMYSDDQEANVAETTFESNRAKRPGADAGTPASDEPTGEGAGFYAHVQKLQLQDSKFIENKAEISGGGLNLSGTVDKTANIFNCLFAENTAGRDGGGASVNWWSRAKFGNCTFADNSGLGIFRQVETGEYQQATDPVTGDPLVDAQGNPILVPVTIQVQDFPSSGGGLAVSYDSIADVNDSIFWANVADQGESIYLGASSDSEPRPSTLTVAYSTVANYPSANAIYVEPGSTLNEGFGITSDNPHFVTLPGAATDDVTVRYYLDQLLSPCVDTGSRFASDLGLSNYTTSVTGALDKGRVDLGFHYKQAAKVFCRLADLVLSGTVNLPDWAIFASGWLSLDSCGPANNWCSGADLNTDTVVNAEDLTNFANCWLAYDDEPPFPSPAEWELEPNAVPGTFDTIEMAAAQHHDKWWPDENLQYYFECVTPANGPDRDWSYDRRATFTAADGIEPGITYTYVVRVRDPMGNVTDDSLAVPVTPGDNTLLPAAQWLDPPFVKDDQYAIQMEAVAYLDLPTVSGIAVPTLPDGFVIKYQFDYTGTAGGGDDRPYNISPVYVDDGMVANQTYSYRVRMGLFYEPGDGTSTKITDGPWSSEASVVAVLPDLTAPVPNPAEHESGYPLTQSNENSVFYHYVRAVEATDDSGVEYKFVCIDSPTRSSGGADGNGPEWRNVDNVGAGVNAAPEDVYYPLLTAASTLEIQVPNEYRVRTNNKQGDWRWYIIVRDRAPQHNRTWAPDYLPDPSDPQYQTILDAVNAQVRSPNVPAP